MKKVILIVEDSAIGTLVNVLAGTYSSITIEDFGGKAPKLAKPAARKETYRPKRRRQATGPKPNSGTTKAMNTLRNKPEGFTIADACAAFEAAGLSMNSAVPSVSKALGRGDLRKEGNVFVFTH